MSAYYSISLSFNSPVTAVPRRCNTKRKGDTNLKMIFLLKMKNLKVLGNPKARNRIDENTNIRTTLDKSKRGRKA